MHRIALSDVTTEQAIAIWRAGVAAVGGKTVVRNALRKRSGPPADAVLAVGKAASSMLLGALPFLAPSVRGLLVTKYGHVDPALRHEHTIKSMESGHPVPDENSLMAGHAALRFIASCPPDCRLLVLVSGGASALMEVPVPDMDLTRLQQISQTLLSDGYAIDQINQVRMRLSRVKGGRLLRRFQGQSIQVLGLSDIPGDQAELIGSGVGAVTPPKVTAFAVPPGIQAQMPSVPDDLDRVPEKLSFQFQSQLVGSNALARTAAAQAAEDMGLTVVESGDYLNDNIEKLAPVLAQRLDRGGPGVYLWGGEPTVHLPEKPGIGGRNQSLALALTLTLVEDLAVCGVVAGTDGTDGPTQAAGGLVGPAVDCGAGWKSLRAADAGSWLERHGRRFVTGTTGTNVMDLAVLVRKERG